MNKKMKKAIVLAVAFLIIVPNFVSAASVADLQAQINALLAQIQQLQTQLAQQTSYSGGSNASNTWCHTFNTDLGIGSSGTEITDLVTALVTNGVGGKINGSVYDEGVASYVSAFQQKYKSEILIPAGLSNGTGYLGARTRAKLNKLYGCGNTVATQATANVTQTTTQTVAQTTSGLSITTSSSLPNGKVSTASNTYNYRAILNVLPSNISTTQLSWSVVSGSLPSGLYLTASDYGEIITGAPTTAGTYNFTLSASAPSVSGLNPNYASKQFSLTVEAAPTTNSSPTSPVISGPTSVVAGTSNLYTAVSTDPNNDSITYTFDWGDGTYKDNKNFGSGYGYSVYHVWKNNGIYPITVTASDDKGGISTNTIYVKVSVPFTVTTDSDNSPNYSLTSPSNISSSKYPDLFVKGVGKGTYSGGGVCIYGTDPNPASCKPTSDTFTTFWDHCVNSSQLNEAYVNTEGKLSSIGIIVPGYTCSNGTLVANTPANGFLSFSKSALVATYIQGSPLPSTITGSANLYTNTQYNQSLTFTNVSNVTVKYKISVPNKPSWLNSSYEPGELTAYAGDVVGLGGYLDPTSVANSPGTYSTSIILTGNFTGSPITIPVTLTVVAQTPTSTKSPLNSCITNTSTGATYSGYYYYPEKNLMVSSYCLPLYDNCNSPRYTINGTNYWFRMDGKDATTCKGFGTISAANQTSENQMANVLMSASAILENMLKTLNP